MKKLVSFFEIPAADFNRAVAFYENVFGIKMPVMDCGHEKMAFFPDEEGLATGAVSWTEGFRPSGDGVLVSLYCRDMSDMLANIQTHGGKTVTGKTKIECEGRGYFSVFTDSEGNRLGLYSDK